MEPSALSNIKVLVADDEPQLRALVAGRLREIGCSVIEAQDGVEAWHAVQGRTLDVVILDVMMPGMSGWDVCRRIKTDPAQGDPRRGPPKVLMLTGIGEHLNEMTSPLFSADAWIDKPFSLKVLVDKVVELAGMDQPGADEEVLPRGLLPDEPQDPEPAPAAAVGPSVKKATPGPELVSAAAARPAKKVAAKGKPAAKAAKKVAPKRTPATKPAKKAAKKVVAKGKPATKPVKKAAKKVAAKGKPVAKPANKVAAKRKPAPAKAAKKAAPKRKPAAKR